MGPIPCTREINPDCRCRDCKRARSDDDERAELAQLRRMATAVTAYLALFETAVEGRTLAGRPVTGDDLTRSLERVRDTMPPAWRSTRLS